MKFLIFTAAMISISGNAQAQRSQWITSSSLSSSMTPLENPKHISAVLAIWEEKFNDASSLSVTLVGKTTFPPSKEHFLSEIPVFVNDVKQQLRVRATADCMLETFALEAGDDDKPTIYRLKRIPGAKVVSQAEPRPVSVEEFALKRNDENKPGRPPMYFERVKNSVSNTMACSEADALSIISGNK